MFCNSITFVVFVLTANAALGQLGGVNKREAQNEAMEEVVVAQRFGQNQHFNRFRPGVGVGVGVLNQRQGANPIGSLFNNAIRPILHGLQHIQAAQINNNPFGAPNGYGHGYNQYGNGGYGHGHNHHHNHNYAQSTPPPFPVPMPYFPQPTPPPFQFPMPYFPQPNQPSFPGQFPGQGQFPSYPEFPSGYGYPYNNNNNNNNNNQVPNPSPSPVVPPTPKPIPSNPVVPSNPGPPIQVISPVPINPNPSKIDDIIGGVFDGGFPSSSQQPPPAPLTPPVAPAETSPSQPSTNGDLDFDIDVRLGDIGPPVNKNTQNTM